MTEQVRRLLAELSGTFVLVFIGAGVGWGLYRLVIGKLSVDRRTS